MDITTILATVAGTAGYTIQKLRIKSIDHNIETLRQNYIDLRRDTIDDWNQSNERSSDLSRRLANVERCIETQVLPRMAKPLKSIAKCKNTV